MGLVGDRTLSVATPVNRTAADATSNRLVLPAPVGRRCADALAFPLYPQSEKNSVREYVFRYAPESGHAVLAETYSAIPKSGLGVFFMNERKRPSSGPTATTLFPAGAPPGWVPF